MSSDKYNKLHAVMKTLNDVMSNLIKQQQQTIAIKIAQTFDQITAQNPKLFQEVTIIKNIATNIASGNAADGIYASVLQKLSEANANKPVTDWSLEQIRAEIARQLEVTDEEFAKCFGQNDTLKLDLLRVQCAIDILLDPKQSQQHIKQFGQQMTGLDVYGFLNTSLSNITTPKNYFTEYGKTLRHAKELGDDYCAIMPILLVHLNQQQYKQIADENEESTLTDSNHDELYKKQIINPLIEQQVSLATFNIDWTLNQINQLDVVIIVRDRDENIALKQILNNYGASLEDKDCSDIPKVYTYSDKNRLSFNSPPHRIEVYTYTDLLDNKHKDLLDNKYKGYYTPPDAGFTPCIVLDAPNGYREQKALNIKRGLIYPILTEADPNITNVIHANRLDNLNRDDKNCTEIYAETVAFPDKNDNWFVLRELSEKCRTLEQLATAEQQAPTTNIKAHARVILDFMASTNIFDDTDNPTYLRAVRIISKLPRTGQQLIEAAYEQSLQQTTGIDINNNLKNALILSQNQDVQHKINNYVPPTKNDGQIKWDYLKNTPPRGFGSCTHQDMHDHYREQINTIYRLLGSGYNEQVKNKLNEVKRCFANGQMKQAIQKIKLIESMNSEQQTKLCIAFNNLDAIASTKSYSDYGLIRLLQQWQLVDKDQAISRAEIVESLNQIINPTENNTQTVSNNNQVNYQDASPHR